jgi:hypothetical protein
MTVKVVGGNISDNEGVLRVQRVWGKQGLVRWIEATLFLFRINLEFEASHQCIPNFTQHK